MGLDEPALRREGFEGGTPVVLADGREWTLARPRVRLVPDNSEAGFRTTLARPDDGTYRRLADALDAVWKDGVAPVSELARVELGLGRCLLLANYDLSDAQVADLLQFSYEEDRDADPDGHDCREAVMNVARGFGPKRSAVGGE